MASSNWVPAAEAMDTGFALDELLRKERAANARQMMSEQGGLARQQMVNQAGMERQNAANENALARMLEEHRLKEADRLTQAGEQADALQSLFQNSPEARKAFGYELPTPAVAPQAAPMEAGQDEEAAAFNPRTLGTPATAGSMPTREALIGMAKASPSLFQAYTQKRIEGMAKPQGLITAGPVGSSRVDLQACKLEYSIVSPK